MYAFLSAFSVTEAFFAIGADATASASSATATASIVGSGLYGRLTFASRASSAARPAFIRLEK